MAESKIKIQLLPEEQLLLLQYGYPFEPEKKKLQKLVKSERIGSIQISPFYLEQLIGNLCYSINKRTTGRTQQELSELCDRLEYAERSGDGMLDIF